MEIRVTREEEKLFAILLNCIKGETVARAAGGWVRDKLLGAVSDDIDIALNDISGVAFAQAVNRHLEEIGEETHSLGIIQANPEQSKHLETANIRIIGMAVDCVNLRAESYASHSRIPEIRFGTPLEDALRRDFTINSMFYNLNTREIEDFTGRGLEDLRNRLIRTPLPAITTFTDDPLRVLRGIRFASRLFFRLHDEISSAAQNPEVHEALRTKVSRERVLKEMEGMVHSQNDVRPFVAFRLVQELRLTDAIFPLPTELTARQQLTPDQQDGLVHWASVSLKVLFAINVLACLKERHNLPLGLEATAGSSCDLFNVVIGQSELTAKRLVDERSRVLWWAGAVSGMRDVQVVDKKKRVNLAGLVLKENLKMDSETIHRVENLFESVDLLRSASEIRDLSEPHVRSTFRDIVGKAFRRSKSDYESAVLLSCAWDVAMLLSFEAISGPVVDFIVREDVAEVLHRYVRLFQSIVDEKLVGIWDLKPMMNGNELREMLGIDKGPNLGKLMCEQLDWQIRNPEGSKDECLVHLKLVISG